MKTTSRTETIAKAVAMYAEYAYSRSRTQAYERRLQAIKREDVLNRVTAGQLPMQSALIDVAADALRRNNAGAYQFSG